MGSALLGGVAKGGGAVAMGMVGVVAMAMLGWLPW